METLSRAFPKLGIWTRGAEAGGQLAARAPGLLADLERTATSGLVKTGRSAWTHHRAVGSDDYAIKTYVYSTVWERIRAWPRTWLPSRSRAHREWDALAWMRSAGFAAPRPVAVAEVRRFGWLVRATLIVEWWPGSPLDQLLPTLPPPAQDELLAAMFQLVHDLHRRGFRDRNLDLRNLLARREQGRWQVVKIDSGRFRLRPADRADDALARADWARLLPQLAASGVPAARWQPLLSP